MMPLLHIAFQEGFEGDTVFVRIAGHEVFRKDNVKTSAQVGYATSFDTNSHDGPVSMDIVLPSKNLSETVQLQLLVATFVGVSIRQGKINYRISNDPFRYL
jgi:hypothetical protein